MKTHISDANKAICEAPRTNSCLTAILDADGFVDQSNCPERWVSHSRELERELNAATSEVKRLRKANLQLREGAEEQKLRIKRLEEAGDAMMSEPCEYTFEQWIKAKEDKL